MTFTPIERFNVAHLHQNVMLVGIVSGLLKDSQTARTQDELSHREISRPLH